MNMLSSARGGAAVGLVTDLPEVEAGAVLYFRLWADGPEGQASVWNALASSLGAGPARPAMKAFERLCVLTGTQCRRRLMHHSVSCACLGADEAVFANMVAAASTGDREEAAMFAALIVRPDMAPAAAYLAEQFGVALRQSLVRTARANVSPSAKSNHVH